MKNLEVNQELELCNAFDMSFKDKLKILFSNKYSFNFKFSIKVPEGQDFVTLNYIHLTLEKKGE